MKCQVFKKFLLYIFVFVIFFFSQWDQYFRKLRVILFVYVIKSFSNWDYSQMFLRKNPLMIRIYCNYVYYNYIIIYMYKKLIIEICFCQWPRGINALRFKASFKFKTILLVLLKSAWKFEYFPLENIFKNIFLLLEGFSSVLLNWIKCQLAK